MNRENNSRVPRLRFPVFTGEWKEMKIGDLYERHNVKNDLSFGVDKIISVANMYYKSDAKVGDDDYLRSYNIFRYGDIAFEGNKSANYAFGRFVENTIGDGIVSHVFDVYSPISPDHCLEYWKYAINYESLMRPILEKSTKKTTMMTNLVSNDFLRQTILVPSHAEQKKIAECLTEMDKMIAAQGENVDALKEKKKGLMQQLFPQDEESTPSMRFTGFAGDWVVKTLREVSSSFSGGTPKSSEPKYYGGHIPFIRSGEIHGDRTELYITEDGLNNSSAKLVKNGDLLIALYGATSGEVAISKINGAINQAILCVRSNVMDTRFLCHYLEYCKDFITGRYLQGGQGNLSSDIIMSLHIAFPSLAEQQKIAECLSVLDDQIAAETAKLEALKDHKKGLMQQLFPQPDK